MKKKVPWVRLVAVAILLLCLVMVATASDSSDDAGVSGSDDGGSADAGDAGDASSAGDGGSAGDGDTGGDAVGDAGGDTGGDAVGDAGGDTGGDAVGDAGGDTVGDAIGEGEANDSAADAPGDESSSDGADSSTESGSAEGGDPAADQDTGTSSPADAGEENISDPAGAEQPAEGEGISGSEDTTDTGAGTETGDVDTSQTVPEEPAAEAGETGETVEELVTPIEEPVLPVEGPSEVEIVAEEPVQNETPVEPVETTAIPVVPVVPEPALLCIWVQDNSDNLEDGDPVHSLETAQFTPPRSFGGVKPMQVFVVMRTDTLSEGVLPIITLTGANEDTWNAVPEALTREEGMEFWDAAVDTGLMLCQEGISSEAVRSGLEQGTMMVFSGASELSFDAEPGEYQVKVTAGSGEEPESLEQTFTYLASGCVEYGFSGIDYGVVPVGVRKTVEGDDDFETMGQATVRNCGNVPVFIQLEQDDMGLGQDVNATWLIRYAARLGREGTESTYDPFQLVTLSDPLLPGAVSGLDFSIEVKGVLGLYSGNYRIGWITTEELQETLSQEPG